MVLDFKLFVDSAKNPPILRVNGEIDIYTCPKLGEALESAAEGKSKTLILNLENVHYIDSTGLGTIAKSALSLSAYGGQIKIVCSKPQVKKVFEVSGLSKRNVVMFENEAAALADTQ